MKINFKHLDFFDLDRHLSEDNLAVRDAVRELTDTILLAKPKGFELPLVAELYRRGGFPLDEQFIFERENEKEEAITLRQRLAELGLFQICLSASMGLAGESEKKMDDYGAMPGFDYFGYGVAMREIERGDSGIRSFISVQCGLVMHAIYSLGSEEQKLKWLPLLALGKKIGCFGATEAGSGSNVSGYKTKAVKDGRYYILNGVKEWITSAAAIADIAIVWAKTEDGVLRAFIVERGTSGFSTSKIEYKNAMRASDTGCIQLTDCKVPEENILPIFYPKETGNKSLLQCFSQARFGIGWGMIGAAQACYEAAHNFVSVRQVSGGLLAGKQLIQSDFAEMARLISCMQLFAREMTVLREQKKMEHEHISMVKMNNCDLAFRVARIADRIIASASMTDEVCVGRHLNNIRAVDTYEGAYNIQELIIGHGLLGNWAL